jgi:hypothetical protein
VTLLKVAAWQWVTTIAVTPKPATYPDSAEPEKTPSLAPRGRRSGQGGIISSKRNEAVSVSDVILEGELEAVAAYIIIDTCYGVVRQGEQPLLMSLSHSL